MCWFSLHAVHSLQTCLTSSFQLGQYMSVLARSFDLTSPICDSCNLFKNCHFKPIGTTILFWKNMIPSTICNSYLCWKYGLMSHSNSLPLSDHPSCMTLVSLTKVGSFIVNLLILCQSIHTGSTPRSAICKFNVSSL